jgi:hypothetical protein
MRRGNRTRRSDDAVVYVVMCACVVAAVLAVGLWASLGPNPGGIRIGEQSSPMLVPCLRGGDCR